MLWKTVVVCSFLNKCKFALWEEPVLRAVSLANKLYFRFTAKLGKEKWRWLTDSLRDYLEEVVQNVSFDIFTVFFYYFLRSIS